MSGYRLHLRHISDALLNKDLKVNVHLDTVRLIHLLSFRFQFSKVFHLFPTVLPVLLQPLYLIEA